MPNKKLLTGIATTALLAFAGDVSAHPWPYHVSGFSAGVVHPMTGLDHILAMIAVGLCAVQQGKRSLWLLPLAFIGAMLLGGTIGLLSGHPLSVIEQGIAASVLILGLIVATGSRVALPLILPLVSLFAIFHGYAHGVEMQPGHSPATYALGFVVSTSLLLGLGVTMGFAIRRLRIASLYPVLGSAMTVCGVAMFWM